MNCIIDCILILVLTVGSWDSAYISILATALLVNCNDQTLAIHQ